KSSTLSSVQPMAFLLRPQCLGWNPTPSSDAPFWAPDAYASGMDQKNRSVARDVVLSASEATIGSALLQAVASLPQLATNRFSFRIWGCGAIESDWSGPRSC